MFTKHFNKYSWLYYPSLIWAIQLGMALCIVFIFTHVIKSDDPHGHFGHLISWDGGWYIGIARTGYQNGQSPVFFPLYPLLIYLLHHTGITYAHSAVMITNLALLFSMIFLYRFIVTSAWQQDVAKRTLWLLTSFPLAFFFNCAYTESLTLLCYVLFFYCLQRDYWYRAILFGFLATIIHDLGLLLTIVGLVYLWNRRKVISHYTLAIRFLSLGLIPLALILYFLYLYLHTGNPHAYFDAVHQSWRKHIVPSTLYIFYYFIHIYFHPNSADANVVMICNAFATLVITGMGILMFTKYRHEFSPEMKVFFVLTLIASTIVSSHGSLEGWGRYMIVLFPGFIAWARCCEKEFWILFSITIMLPLKTILLGMFANWYWLT